MHSYLVAALLAAPALATDLNVPGDAASIPAAVALAQNGDTIHVGRGEWTGAVDFGGKTLRLMSDEGFAETTIDGGAAAFAVNIPTAPGTCTLTGFTIVGGTTGRVLVADDATLSRCRIGGGPGFGVQTTPNGGGRKILDCLITGNTSTGVLGAGVVRVERCLIDGNGSPATSQGGGVYGGLSVDVTDCIISHNTAKNGGGAVALGKLTGTLFLENHATDSGGACWLNLNYDNNPTPLFENLTFLGNTAPLGGGVHLPDPGFAFSPAATFTGCTFAGNLDDHGNVGLLSEMNDAFFGSTTVDRCTFAGDGLRIKKVGIVWNSIVRDATITPGTALAVSWSDIEGGWPGFGNFDADPQWVDAPHVFALLPGSPCIDAGDPNPNVLDPDGSRVDVGALPLAPFADARQAHFGFNGLPGLAGAGALEPSSPLSLTLVRGRPGAIAALILGFDAIHAPFKDGVLVPQPDLVIAGLPISAQGTLELAGTWPSGIPSGFVAWAQVWVQDAAASKGFAASNGLGLVAP